MIDLTATKAILREAMALANELDGADHRDVLGDNTKAAEREERVKRSRQLQLLAGRLLLAQGLVLNEYWVARGESDPLSGEHHDD